MVGEYDVVDEEEYDEEEEDHEMEEEVTPLDD